MSTTELISGYCPNCKEALQIPAHLKQFSCMYCGTRLTPGELMNDLIAEPASTADSDAALRYYQEHVIEVITKHIGIEKEMNRAHYVSAFERYSDSNEHIFRQLDLAVNSGACTAEEAAAYFIDQLELRWDAEVKKRKRRSAVMDIDKFVIAIFLVPMVRRMKLSISEPYTVSLQAQWVSRYPKSPFYLGEYEEFSTGFQKRFLGLCFITTAVCRSSGKPDDCAELTAFRSFRDGYLRACPDGPALIDEYYDVAPGIVLRIELSHDRDEQYAAIRETYLEPCFRDIQAGRLQQCKDRYVAMVRNLEQEYLQ